MNAGWILRAALVCGSVGGVELCCCATSEAQYGQPPASASARIVAQPTTQYGAQANPQYSTQFQPANTQPALPPTQYAQPAATQPRGSVFSAQPTVNDPRYTASVTNDPRYASAPQLSPPENSTLQQYANQLNNAASQFTNTLRDAQQQAQQYGQQAQPLTQQAQQYAQQAQQLGQTAQQWQQQAQQLNQQVQQLGQQAQPYLSSLTNNPYAYVPAQQPQPDPGANQYLAANSQTADNQFGRSVLVNSQPNNASSFGQYAGGQQYVNQQQQPQQQQQQQQQPASSFVDNRFQGYQQPSYQQPNYNNQQQPATQLVATNGQSAFTNSGAQNQSGGVQDQRLMQPPALNDPRTTPDQRPLTLEPPLTATLPNGAGQGSTNSGSGQLNSPYANVQTPRIDGQNNTGSNFANNSQPPNNATTNFASNNSKTEVPSLFNNVLPTNAPRSGAAINTGANPTGNGFGATFDQFGSTLNANAVAAAAESERSKKHFQNVLIGSLLCLFASIGANFYFGWNFTEYYFRYRRLLVEGEEDDRSRMRDDDRRR